MDWSGSPSLRHPRFRSPVRPPATLLLHPFFTPDRERLPIAQAAAHRGRCCATSLSHVSLPEGDSRSAVEYLLPEATLCYSAWAPYGHVYLCANSWGLRAQLFGTHQRCLGRTLSRIGKRVGERDIKDRVPPLNETCHITPVPQILGGEASRPNVSWGTGSGGRVRPTLLVFILGLTLAYINNESHCIIMRVNNTGRDSLI